MAEEKPIETTTIRVDPQVVEAIEKKKVHPRQSNNEVLRILLGLDDPKFIRADKLVK